MRNQMLLLISIGLIGSGVVAGPVQAEDAPSGRFAQTISMPQIPDTTVDRPVGIDASASSLLPVQVSVAGSCALQDLLGGQQILATGAGTCVVTASQQGDDRWLPAPTVSQEFQFIGGEAGSKISNAGPDTYLSAQGLPLTVSVTVSSDHRDGRAPTGTVIGQLRSIIGGPACTGCGPVAVDLRANGQAVLVVPGSFTATLAAGGYSMAVDYSGDAFFDGGRLFLPDIRIVTPGDIYAGSEPIVVSMGDSYISGEGGRWAGNAFALDEAWRTDTNPNTYNDRGGYAESIAGCHRSSSAEIHIEQAGAEVLSVNLACSGAQTTTFDSGINFKPGLDFYQSESTGRRGQALELYRLASANPGRIKMVVLSIGGNDFHFGGIVQACVQNFLTWQEKCSKLPEVRRLFDTPNVELQLAKMVGALDNINEAMAEAGYSPDEWTLVQQDYPSPVPGAASRIRYPETISRVTAGGCGMYNADLAYANDTMLATINATVKRAGAASQMPNVRFLDLTDAYVGNRLCEKGVDLVSALNDVERWTDDNAVLGSEWIAAIRLLSLAHDGHPYWTQESLHPNYWGQLANQVCVKLAWNDGDVLGGTCVRGDGAYDPASGTSRSYPVMVLIPD
ncbi:MAG: hypothetical protein F2840_07460 [Actinobacteria bacterium]|uniref:Unannotated protein n=1 Tax=freshwater metagenome TaxID=449393 RepID=A0A6J7K7E0_9ZZZZ|nr:hypothetical protein [Actinomycetota bacterium]